MIIDGKQLSQEILEELKIRRAEIKGKIRLAAVLVGENPASISFLKQKEKFAKELDIDFHLYKYPETYTTKDLRKQINVIGKSAINSGIIVQLPLPEHINTQVVLNAIPGEKDVDVLSEKLIGSFFVDRSNVLPPPVEVIKTIFDKYSVDLSGQHVAVVGAGALIGKPIIVWFINNRASVSVIRSKTKNKEKILEIADIIISGVGEPNLIKGDSLKDGVIAIDFGYSFVNEKICGDFEFESVSKKARLITPTPGGTGPILVAALFRNLITLIENRK